MTDSDTQARQPNLTPEQFRDAAMQLSPEVRATAIGMIQVVEAMDRMTGKERLDILDYLHARYVEQSPRELLSTSLRMGDSGG